MPFVAAKCPQCGGDLQVPEERDIVKCMYCGVDVVVREAVRLVVGNASAYMELAVAAEDAGNYAEGYKYFTQVIELDPNNPSAWAGKGRCAAWQSNLLGQRFDEFKLGYEKAFDLTKDEADLVELKKDCVLHGFKVATALFNLSLKHTLEFISVPSSQLEHGERCVPIINLCKFLLTIDNSADAVREFMVDIAGRCLKISHLSDGDKGFFRSVIDQNTRPSSEKYVNKAVTEDGSAKIFAWFGVALSFVFAWYLVAKVANVSSTILIVILTPIVTLLLSFALALVIFALGKMGFGLRKDK